MPTRQRLVAAAIEVFGEQGFSQASVGDIAERAGVSGPAVYKHFDTKADVLIHAARCSLDTLGAATTTARSPHDLTRLWLSDDFAPTRRLLLELHLAAGRETDVAALLTDWHVERARSWELDRNDTVEQIKAFYLLLLGLAHVDSLASLDAEPAMLNNHIDRMVDALFPDLDRSSRTEPR